MENTEYSSELETLDWRYSAAVYGLMQYLEHHGYHYNKDCIELAYGPQKAWDIFRFNKEDITEDNYLQFVEHHFLQDMHHKIVEDCLRKKEFTEGEIKFINEKLTANTVMKKYFDKLKFDGSNKDEILETIEYNRQEIVTESFRYKKNLYSNFCNVNQLFKEKQGYSRLRGYYIDGPKKGKSISYQFDPNTFISEDSEYFDFIPFAFTIGRESVFINDSSSLKDLFATNQMLQSKIEYLKNEDGKIDVRKALFQSIIESSEYLDYDVEVILKDVEKDYFETLFIRKECIRIFKQIKKFEMFCFSYKINENYYLNVQRKVTESIMNSAVLDELIEMFLKDESKTKQFGKFQNLNTELLKLNQWIRSSYMHIENEKKEERCEQVNQSMKIAYASAGQVVKTLESRNQINKITSYRTKLTSAIVFKDYKRFCDILMQLANYCDVQFTFAYDLFEDFEGNKDLAYAFINALVQNTWKNEKNQDTNTKNVDLGGK